MAPAPTQVRIRSYNVGFGDCFLLTFGYDRAKPRNVMIDFGSTKQSATGPRGEMLEIAEQIREDCGGKLQMLVATHRHADHISGFAGKPGEVIASLDPDLVVQPWTEDPDLDPDAKAPAGSGSDGTHRARAVVSRLSAMQALAEAALAAVPKLEASAAVPQTVADQVRFLGETNLKNAESVRNLATMGRKHVYVNFGTKLALSKLLPGIRVDVLGPPTLEQSAAISHQASTDEDEFWHLAARQLGADGAGGAEIFPGAATTRRAPQEARWVIPRVDQMQGEETLAIVRSLDGALNNTSVILLFEIGESRLVFPGDAQLENWSYALHECDEAEEIRARLADARFYKVGHHGSLNATPKSLWNGFEKRKAKPGPERLATMVSTAAGKHGSAARGTEVPRKVLIDELERMSDLRNTQSLKSRELFWNDVELEL
ncbi:MAG TPA: hypothetical protein VEW07_09305 [Solirubrobacterales bacterium]|nr:hypothetical protein [Solirubrobacterales bacterium]